MYRHNSPNLAHENRENKTKKVKLLKNIDQLTFLKYK